MTSRHWQCNPLVISIGILACVATALAHHAIHARQLMRRESVESLRHGCTYAEVVAALGPPRNATWHQPIPPLRFGTGGEKPWMQLGVREAQWYFRNAFISAYFTPRGRLLIIFVDRPRFYDVTTRENALLIADAALLLGHFSDQYAFFPSQLPAAPWLLPVVLAVAWTMWLGGARLALPAVIPATDRACWAVAACGAAAYLDGAMYPI
jgi:hypothetical protein